MVRIHLEKWVYLNLLNLNVLLISGVNSEDALISQLVSAQTQLNAIQSNVATLVHDLIQMRKSDRPGKRKRSGRPSHAHQALPSKKPKPSNNNNNLSPEESLALRSEVAQLSEEEQQKVVQIMVTNNEPLSTDANGYTEIDLGSCSGKTVRQIQNFVKSCKKKKLIQQQQQQQQLKQQQESDDSSDESSDDDSSSSSSSDDSD